MKKNKFVVIVPFRNCSSFIGECANSLLNQNYKNWMAIFSDDQSSDDIESKIPREERIHYRKTSSRLFPLGNIHETLMNSNLNDEDVICILDGDDHLIGNNVFGILNNLYQDEILLVYGQYLFPWGQAGHCKAYRDSEYFEKNMRTEWLASHMKTFRYKLYKEVVRQDENLDFFRDTNGNFYTMTGDIALMTPMLAIAGFDRIRFNPTPIYQYRFHENNDHSINPSYQKQMSEEIRNKPFPFKYAEIA